MVRGPAKSSYQNLRASERSKRLEEMEPANEFLLLKGTMNKNKRRDG